MTTPEPRASQLALGLTPAQPAELPPIDIAPEWKDQQRLWGHSFHPMCSYLASFPAALAHAFIARYSRRGDVVLDPFSGRGTTPLQASAEGRIGVGNDLNPFAHLLTASKVEAASPARRGHGSPRCDSHGPATPPHGRPWRNGSMLIPRRSSRAPAAGPRHTGGDEPVPAEVAVAFHPRTLAQLLLVRTSLDLDRPTDRFLAAALTGILHGKSASYLSEIMPNTFSMAPRYVREFAARTAFSSPERDVFDCLELKLARLYRQAAPSTPRGSPCSATPATSRPVPGGAPFSAAYPTVPAWS